jgi:hypothetical protein
LRRWGGIVLMAWIWLGHAVPFCASAPNEGGGAPERVTDRTAALARRDELPPGRREGASRRSTWRFSAAGPALRLPAAPTGIRAATRR